MSRIAARIASCSCSLCAFVRCCSLYSVPALQIDVVRHIQQHIMASTGGVRDTGNDALEIGCLSVQVVGARNVRLGGGGYVDLFLNPQVSPYCKITLGVSRLPLPYSTYHSGYSKEVLFSVPWWVMPAHGFA